jgi:nucleoside phosphorylase
MNFPIEVLSVGADLYAAITPPIEQLNAAQDEFRFYIPRSTLRDYGLPFVQNEYHSDDVFELLERYREQAKGHHPHLIAVINGRLRSSSLINIFGSHRAASGLAVFTLWDSARYAPTTTSFITYYLVRYTLSFLTPKLKSHEERRGCFFDKKLQKQDIRQSLATGGICDPCMKDLSGHMTPEMHRALSELRKVLQAIAAPADGTKKAVPLHHNSTDISVEYDPEEQEWYPTDPPELKDASFKDLKSGQKRPDLLILVATPIELRATLRLLKPMLRKNSIWRVKRKKQTYYLGTCGCFSAALTMCAMGSIGRDAAITTAKDALNIWKPRAVVMLGYAMGRSRHKQRIADVLVSETIVPYETVREGQERIPRASHPLSGKGLLDAFRNAQGWKFERPDREACRMQIGAILSGEKLVDNPDFKANLFAQHPQAIGLEMEGAGVFAAAASENTEWIIAKGISDWGDGAKTASDKHRPLAAAAAASLVFHVLSSKTALEGIRAG